MPVVLFAIPELAWLPDACCVKVPPFDQIAFGKAMIALCQNPELRRSMGEAAKRLARNFNWDDLAKKYEDFFETALQYG